MENTSVKIGDIYECSWGYEQTNVNFYQVVGLTKSMVTVREIKAAISPNSDMVGTVTPRVNEFIGEPLTRRFKIDYIKVSGSQYISLWDGRPVRYSCYA